MPIVCRTLSITCRYIMHGKALPLPWHAHVGGINAYRLTPANITNPYNITMRPLISYCKKQNQLLPNGGTCRPGNLERCEHLRLRRRALCAPHLWLSRGWGALLCALYAYQALPWQNAHRRLQYYE